MTGSHLDSVPGGGAFDGPLGVVSALLAVDELRLRGLTPARPLAMACFAEEEGGRFGLPCMGSRLLTGAVDADQVRRLHDGDGASVAEAARRAGIDPAGMGPDPARLASIGTFVELHVEQGRLLQTADAAAVVGVGSEILAHGRWRITVNGQGNHAGTTRPADRKDPMIPAAAAVFAARRATIENDGAVATVGRINPMPGGTNVIASSVQLWLDVRHESASVTAGDRRRHCRSGPRRGRRRGLHRHSAARVDGRPGVLRPGPRTGAVRTAGGAGDPDRRGARCRRVLGARAHRDAVRPQPSGVSHAPEEYADAADCLVGIDALADVLENLVR